VTPAAISSVAADFASGAIVQANKAIAVLASGEGVSDDEKMARLLRGRRWLEQEKRSEAYPPRTTMLAVATIRARVQTVPVDERSS
jgi:hypothetical protein